MNRNGTNKKLWIFVSDQAPLQQTKDSRSPYFIEYCEENFVSITPWSIAPILDLLF